MRIAPLVLLFGSAAFAADVTMVVCAPGYPGSTVEAQPAMEGFADAVADAIGWDAGVFAAEYHETEDGGVDRLTFDDAGLGLVTLPFFLEHSEALDLHPEMLAVPTGHEAGESWSLVAGSGRIRTPDDLDGWQLTSLAGHSEAFVRGPALGDWGELPESMTITFSGAVLSALRKAAHGDDVAVLLDAEQTRALDRLPFAKDLEIVHRSPPLPVSVVCSVGDRLSPEIKAELMAGLAGLADRPEAAEAMEGVRLERFEALDAAGLERATTAFEGAAE